MPKDALKTIKKKIFCIAKRLSSLATTLIDAHIKQTQLMLQIEQMKI